ncbi:MAG: GspH/FimT family pseudopilin [Inhella sp.]
MRSRGFSIVELMIAVAILGFALAVSMPLIVDWTRNLAIRNAAESLKGGIEKARQLALRRNTDMSFWLVIDDAKALSNACALSVSGPSWVIAKLNPEGQCGVSPSETDAPRIAEKWSAADGSKEVKLETADEVGTASSQLTFNSLGQVNMAGQLARIDITHAKGGDIRPLRLLISRAGAVRLCDPAVAAGDTRAC